MCTYDIRVELLLNISSFEMACNFFYRLQNSVVAVPGSYGMQAVALRVSGEKAMFYRVRILGAQDTLDDDHGSHYFRQCYIQGSIDFIFGRSRSLYQVSFMS